MVDAEAPVLRLDIIKELLSVFNPLMITVSAPFNEISGPFTVPETVLAAPPEGDIVRVFVPGHCVSSMLPDSDVRSEVISAIRLPEIPKL